MKYLGKYRGTVANNVDPEQRGRIQATVSDVSQGFLTSWAHPCVPMAGPQCGHVSVPPVGASVWVEFEQGDRDHPIWTGCFWGSVAEVPALATAAPPSLQTIVLQTQGLNSLVISDVPGPAGGIQLRSSTGAMILINNVGITITNGQNATIQLTGPSVMINGTALVVT